MTDDQSVTTAYTQDTQATPYPGSRGQGPKHKSPKKKGKHGGGSQLPAISSPRSPRNGGGNGDEANAARSPRSSPRNSRGGGAGGDDDDASHASSITQGAAGPSSALAGADIGVMAQREVQKQFKLAERMSMERATKAAAVAKDLAALNALDEQIEYIRRERLTRLEHDLAARKASHKAVSTEFDAACHRLRGLVDEQQTTTRKSLNRASRLTGDFITSELTARRGYSMKAPTSHYRPHNKRGFNKACGVKLTPVVPGGV